MGSMAMPTSPPGRTRRSPGCLGYGGILFIVILLVAVVGHPWGLHMGGRWTPAMIWHGFGRLHASSGANYTLWLNIGPMAMSSRRSGRRDNFQGTAVLCTPQGQAITLDVFGKVNAWLNADRQPLTMRIATQRNVKPVLSFRLAGQWNGQELFLEDQGSMADSFRADGTPKGFAQGLRAPAENAQASLHYAQKAEFEAVCGAAQSSF